LHNNDILHETDPNSSVVLDSIPRLHMISITADMPMSWEMHKALKDDVQC